MVADVLAGCRGKSFLIQTKLPGLVQLSELDSAASPYCQLQLWVESALIPCDGKYEMIAIHLFEHGKESLLPFTR